MSTAPLPNPDHPGWDQVRHSDTRNVADQFKWMTDEAVRGNLAATAVPGVVAVESLDHDLNLSNVLRTTNAMNLSEFWIVGRRKWDRRGAVGQQHYTPIRYAPHPDEVIPDFRARGYQIVTVDNVPGSIPLPEHTWQPETLLWFGQESNGVSNDALLASDVTVHIPQYGSVRSLNVAVAAGIVIHAYRESLN